MMGGALPGFPPRFALLPSAVIRHEGLQAHPGLRSNDVGFGVWSGLALLTPSTPTLKGSRELEKPFTPGFRSLRVPTLNPPIPKLPHPRISPNPKPQNATPQLPDSPNGRLQFTLGFRLRGRVAVLICASLICARITVEGSGFRVLGCRALPLQLSMV